MISLRGIVFSYPGGRRVLDGLDFALEQGERVGITGPNGSGKTTLLHIMVGLLKPEAGEVEIFGKTRVEEADFKEVRRRVGLLFQDPDDQLFCPTVVEDVAFGPLNLGKRGKGCPLRHRHPRQGSRTTTTLYRLNSGRLHRIR